MANLKLNPHTRTLLETQTLSNIANVVNMVNEIRRGIKMIDNADVHIETTRLRQPSEYPHLRRLSECSMLVGFIWLDITAGFRIYLNAKESYEIIYSIKQLTITINEGFKQIYNYVSIDENGNLKTRERNHSFWVKDIGSIVKNELPHLLPQYNQITLFLDKYDDQELKDMKVPRNLFVHFDKTPSIVYDELQKQDIEKIAIKTIPFMKILSEMLNFNMVLLKDYNDLMKKRKDDMLDAHHKKIEDLKLSVGGNSEALDLLMKLQDFINGRRE